MIRRHFAADDGVRLDMDLHPNTSGDLLATVDRIRGWGGSVRAYRHFLTRALDTAPHADRDGIRSVAVLAGWRAGVTRLRTDALARAMTLDTPVCEAALGLSPGGGAAFLEAQRHDPFAYPTPGPLIGIVGGFRGLGGPWIQPPRDAVSTGPASASVRSGEDWWSIEADVFGATISPAEPPSGTPPRSLMHARTGASYHVWLIRGAA